MRYIQYKDPDAAALRDLINRVKGERSMAKFADDIKITSPNVKVSAPTLSRACNWTEGSSPVSIDLLRAIAAIAPPDSGVTLDKLAEANGMRSAADDSDLARPQLAAVRRKYAVEETERDVKRILQDEIASREYSFQQLNEFSNWRSLHGYIYQRDRVFPRNYTFGFSVSGMSPCNTWKFALDQMQIPKGSAESSIEAHVGNFINKVGAVFASDSFEGELYENEKYSFVFIDRDLYRLFLKRLNDHDILVNGLMTALLVDLNEGRVVEETQLKRYDGEEAASFFKTPTTQPMAGIEFPDPLEMIEDEEDT